MNADKKPDPGVPESDAAPDTTPENERLTEGDRGKPVAQVQRAAQAWYPALGPTLKIDGKFGPKTAEKIRLIQAKHQLDQDSVVDERVLRVLRMIR